MSAEIEEFLAQTVEEESQAKRALGRVGQGGGARRGDDELGDREIRATKAAKRTDWWNSEGNLVPVSPISSPRNEEEMKL